ncbi:hypothetical protein F66182_10385 [Fusarium sp. NRRL 66182]|nr:hypothetical protein F66182_10385 [Fusarium sp. NRRL 66182]
MVLSPTDADESTSLLQHDEIQESASQTYYTIQRVRSQQRDSSSTCSSKEIYAPASSTRATIAVEQPLEAGQETIDTAATETSNPPVANSPEDSRYSSRFINVSPTRFWLIFSGVLLGCIVGSFDSTLMASSHPAITSHFHASNSASWLSTAFLLTWTAFVPCFGRISDTVGRKPIYVTAITIFVIATAWCGAAQSIGSFIAARAFCGLGAGGVSSMGMIISSDVVHLRYRGIYQAYINLFVGIGGCLGLVCGGYLCDQIGWRGAFYIQLPILLVYLALTVVVIPSDLGLPAGQGELSQPEPPAKANMSLSRFVAAIDLLGSVMLVLGLAALVLGLNLGGNVLGWTHPVVISSLVAFLLLAAVFVPYEKGVPRAVVPIKFLSEDPRASIVFGNAFASLSINTMLFNTPLFFQAVKLNSPTDSGVKLVASTFALTLSSVASGFIITWTQHPKPLIILGGVCLLTGACLAATMDVHTPEVVPILSIGLSSLGQGFSYPSLMISILATSSRQDLAVASTTLGLWRNVGSLLGVAISSLIVQNVLNVKLQETVTGPDRDEIIQLVRKSVHAVAELDSVHQPQVIEAYTWALRMTFLSAACWPVLMLALHIRMRLPRLIERK